MPRCHRELFSIFCLLPSSVFLALQQRSGPPTPSTRPAAQLSGVGGDWLLELAEAGAVKSPPHFAASRPLQSLQMSQARVQKPGHQALALGSLPGGAACPQVPTLISLVH